MWYYRNPDNSGLQQLKALRTLLDQYDFLGNDGAKIENHLDAIEHALGGNADSQPSPRLRSYAKPRRKKRRSGLKQTWDFQWVIAAEGISTDYRPLWPVVDAERDRLKQVFNTEDVFADETIDERYFGGFSIFLALLQVKLTRAEAKALLKDVKQRLVKGLKSAGYRPAGSLVRSDDVQGYAGSDSADLTTWN